VLPMGVMAPSPVMTTRFFSKLAMVPKGDRFLKATGS
jgi:hypothetical protein